MVKHQAVQVPGLTPTDKRAAKFRGAVEGLGIRKVVASAAVCEPPKPDSGMGGDLCAVRLLSPLTSIRGGSQEAGEPWKAGTREREARRLAYTETPAPAKRSLFWQFRSPSHRFTRKRVCLCVCLCLRARPRV